MRTTGAIILAGGKGKRMQMESANKVTVSLDNKPMIRHIVDFMHRLAIDTVVVVVGFAKESVIEVLHGYDIIYAEQTEQLGTGHAVQIALEQLPPHIKNVLVVYGDDAVLYAEKHIQIIRKLFDKQFETDAAMTFLTIEQENPFGLGRIVRDEAGKVHAIVEEKDATEEQRTIKEINPGCFVFSVPFLKKYIPLVEKSPATGEYYITSLIDLAFTHKEKVETVQGRNMAWRGVNTPEELQVAEALFKEVRK
jgi:bifunctional UDP-N-acetylglucosamine pyrophosphorylase / glucosamine-1-phosphate N-acetyltransferase